MANETYTGDPTQVRACNTYGSEDGLTVCFIAPRLRLTCDEKRRATGKVFPAPVAAALMNWPTAAKLRDQITEMLQLHGKEPQNIPRQ